MLRRALILGGLCVVVAAVASVGWAMTSAANDKLCRLREKEGRRPAARRGREGLSKDRTGSDLESAGPSRPAGAEGVAGENGLDGEDGIDGEDGVDGDDGDSDGVDGTRRHRRHRERGKYVVTASVPGGRQR